MKVLGVLSYVCVLREKYRVSDRGSIWGAPVREPVPVIVRPRPHGSPSALLADAARCEVDDVTRPPRGGRSGGQRPAVCLPSNLGRKRFLLRLLEELGLRRVLQTRRFVTKVPWCLHRRTSYDFLSGVRM